MRNFKIVIAGWPGTGKTATINWLKRPNHRTCPEAARWVMTRDLLFQGKSALTARGLPFQQAIWQLQARQYHRAAKLKAPKVFFDRGIPDSFAYLKLSRDKAHEELHQLAHDLRYEAVFILEPLPFYDQDSLRTESKSEAARIQRLICQAYQWCGYQPIPVPFGTLERRADVILVRLTQLGA